MRNWYFIVIILLFAQVVVFSAPTLYIADNKVMIEGFEYQELLKHTFELKNTGDEPLEILKAKPSWGCSVADYDKVIQPGQVGKLTLTIRLSQNHTHISKSVKLTTNDPENKEVRLYVEADIIFRVRVLPRNQHHVVVFPEDPPNTASYYLLSTETADLAITRLEDNSNGVITWKYRKLADVSAMLNSDEMKKNPFLKKGLDEKTILSAFQVDATVDPEKLASLISFNQRKQYTATAYTNDAKMKSIKLELFAQLKSYITAYPASLSIFPIKDKVLKRRVYVRSAKNELFTLKQVELAIEGFSYDVKPKQKSMRYTIELSIPYHSSYDKNSYDVIIHLDSLHQDKVSIPLFIQSARNKPTPAVFPK